MQISSNSMAGVGLPLLVSSLLFSPLCSAQNTSTTATPTFSDSILPLLPSSVSAVHTFINGSSTSTSSLLVGTGITTTLTINNSTVLSPSIVSTFKANSTAVIASASAVTSISKTATATSVVVVSASTPASGTASGASASPTSGADHSNRFAGSNALSSLAVGMVAAAIMAAYMA